MIYKKYLGLYAIIFTIVIGTIDIDAQAFTLQDNTLEIDIFGNFLKKVGQGIACFTSQIGKILIIADREQLLDSRLCGSFP